MNLELRGVSAGYGNARCAGKGPKNPLTEAQGHRGTRVVCKLRGFIILFIKFNYSYKEKTRKIPKAH